MSSFKGCWLAVNRLPNRIRHTEFYHANRWAEVALEDQFASGELWSTQVESNHHSRGCNPVLNRSAMRAWMEEGRGIEPQPV